MPARQIVPMLLTATGIVAFIVSVAKLLYRLEDFRWARNHGTRLQRLLARGDVERAVGTVAAVLGTTFHFAAYICPCWGNTLGASVPIWRALSSACLLLFLITVPLVYRTMRRAKNWDDDKPEGNVISIRAS